VNEIYRVEEQMTGGASRVVLSEALDSLVLLMNPFTPHVCEAMWERLGHKTGLVAAAWPLADKALTQEDTIEMAVQVNGKVRGHVIVGRGASEGEIRRLAQAEPRVLDHLRDREIVKAVVVPGRLVSFVVR
jgi:leucyl-tRNA synthetase